MGHELASGLLRLLREALNEHGVTQVDLEAREILALAAGLPKQALYRPGGVHIDPQTAEKAQALLRRRLSGEPLAYLLGEWDFYGISFTLSPAVLIPRVDTELLEDVLLSHFVPGSAPDVLDLCTGSGCVGLTFAIQRPAARVVLADLSSEALRAAQDNTNRHGLADRVSLVRLDALSPPPDGLGLFDALVCNPPYIPEWELQALDVSVRGHEPLQALDGGADGLVFYRALAAYWSSVLRPGGLLAVECGQGQAGVVAGLLAGGGLTGIETHTDTGGIDRVVAGRRKK